MSEKLVKWKKYKLWEITDWDKRFNSVAKGKQRRILSFKHVLAETMKKIAVSDGNIKLLSTGKFDACTTESLAGDSLNAGEVLTIPTGGTASIKYFNGKFVDSGNLIAQSADKNFYSLKFIYYYLTSINDFIASKYKGTGIKHPYMSDILEIEIPIPPREEQERIVRILDKAFEHIEKAKKNAEQNFQNAKELFESCLHKLFTENNENWEEKKLNTLCDVQIGKTPNRSILKFWDKERVSNNTWLSIADLNNTINKEVFDSKEQISDLGASFIKLVKKGTLLLSFKLTIGRVAFAGKDLYTNEAIAQLPIKDSNTINKNYLYYYLQYFDYNKLLNGDIKVKGKTLNKEKLKTLPVCFPPREEQERIVRQLDALQEQTKHLEAVYKQKMKDFDELKQSVLQKAFKGEL